MKMQKRLPAFNKKNVHLKIGETNFFCSKKKKKKKNAGFYLPLTADLSALLVVSAFLSFFDILVIKRRVLN